jgi:rhamnulokinase
MSRYFISCDLGEDTGRVMLGTLQRDKLMLNEIRRFANLPTREKNAVHWNIAQLYQDTLVGLRDIGAYQEPVDGVSCTAWPSDYLLFHADTSFIDPTYHFSDPRTEASRNAVGAKVSPELLYEETGSSQLHHSTLVQVAAENSRRLKSADHLLPIADGFNFLLSGAARVELSSACATQLFNPIARQWSTRLPGAIGLPNKLLPAPVAAGTKLKPLRPELAYATGLEGAQVIASCSNPLAAAMMGLPTQDDESSVCLRLGLQTVAITELTEPFLHPGGAGTDLGHTLGHGGVLYSHIETIGLRVLDECRIHLGQSDYLIDDGVLAYLASAAEPMVSLINLADPRFAQPGDLVAKLQAYCRETGQHVPRKPGPIYRCLMESLACFYRRTVDELSQFAGREFNAVYLLTEANNSILNHFIANALNKPVILAPAQAPAIGNIIVQALAMGRIKTVTEARQILRNSFKTVTVHPHPAATWAPAYERFLELAGPVAPPVIAR